MGRRSARESADLTDVLRGGPFVAFLAVLGFTLEIAMVAAYLFWGFGRPSPWNFVAGIGVPAALVVLWGTFMAPASKHRLGENAVLWLSLVAFAGAGAALLAAGATVPGLSMLAATALYVAVSFWVMRSAARAVSGRKTLIARHGRSSANRP